MVNALITTRVAPHDLNLCEPGRQRVLILDEGLESPFAENILREMDTDGKLGLKARAENDPLLQRARDKTRGYPRALEALFAILSSDRYTTLEELLEMPLPENVVEALVGEAFSRLDTTAQKVMQALAVYNRPVTPAAVDYLLQPHLPEIDSAPVLNRLVNMHFVRRETGQYYLHPVDHDYAFSKIPIDSPPQVGEGVGSEFTRHNLLTRGAGYFSQARKPSTEWKKLEDLNAPLAEFDLLCEAGNYDEAFHILDKIDSEYLFLWGHYRLLIGLHLRVNNKLKDKNLIFRNLNGLGLAYSSQGQIEEAIAFYETGLYIAREIKNKLAEGVFLGNLGNAYRDINDIQKAISVFEKRLAIARNLGDRLGEGIGLGNLGVAYARLGNLHKAIKFYKQALKINREINNLRSEGVTLGRLGAAYATLSNNKKAMGYYEQALEIARKIGDRRNLASWLGNLGSSYANLGDVGNAIKFYEQALVIEQEINDRHGKGTTLSNLGLAFILLGQIHKAIEFSEQALEIAKDIGDRSDEGKRLVHLGNCYAYLGETSKAIKYYEQGLAIDREIGNRSDEATAIGNVGLALLGNNEYEKSIENFKKAIQIADEISYPIVQNEERWGLAQAYLFQNDLVNARTTIEAALQYDIPQYNHNTSTLHGIIVLRQGDESTAQQVFRRAIELADEILAKTSDYYTALDAKGLALCGLALVKDLTGFTESPPAGESVRENLSGLIEQAIETFRAARKIAPHAGVVKSVLRLFDELAKCDPNGILKDVRSAVQGVE
jgi:tetratricopeptide (TPR) repeat protein